VKSSLEGELRRKGIKISLSFIKASYNELACTFYRSRVAVRKQTKKKRERHLTNEPNGKDEKGLVVRQLLTYTLRVDCVEWQEQGLTNPNGWVKFA